MAFDHLLLKVDLDIDLNHDQNDHEKTSLCLVHELSLLHYDVTFKSQNGEI